MSENLEALGVPVCVQIGASLDFVSGRVQRAPKVLQKIGLEWAFRMWLEPRRLIPRYTANAIFLFRMVGRELFDKVRGKPSPPPCLPGQNVLSTPASSLINDPIYESSAKEAGEFSEPARSLN